MDEFKPAAIEGAVHNRRPVGMLGQTALCFPGETEGRIESRRAIERVDFDEVVGRPQKGHGERRRLCQRALHLWFVVAGEETPSRWRAHLEGGEFALEEEAGCPSIEERQYGGAPEDRSQRRRVGAKRPRLWRMLADDRRAAAEGGKSGRLVVRRPAVEIGEGEGDQPRVVWYCFAHRCHDARAPDNVCPR